VATWSEFATAEPALAASIHALVHQYGPGLGYLATIRPDGGPRVHPVSPFITRDGLFCFVIDSPKRRDLERDGRYALHSFPPESTDDEAYVSGRARLVTDQESVQRYAAEMRAEPAVDWRLFEFTIDIAMLVRHGRAVSQGADPRAAYRQIWRDPHAASDVEVHGHGAVG
jgi:Pyridoxamine 5'-phosphate oxidase